ncbi:amino acid adenylation domain-containing protein [Actinosynnema sp. NPDC020468]|uniref:non-ribosomal peptide synthetase n=1 Tax=Actinosynnema sp. NPDC020468 TaxID=3154488 RepID=UPI0033EC9666
MASRGLEGGRLPLSYAQQRLWFLDQMDDTGIPFDIRMAWRLPPDTDPRALRAAFRDVVSRHEVLRTVFSTHDGTPFQEVPDPDAAVVDFRHEQPASVQDALRALAAEPFDLESGPLLRARLFSEGARGHVLVVVLHHIAGDAWSLGPLTRDLATAYGARVAGREPEWPPLPVQYRDYTLWQRGLLGDETDPDSVLSQRLAHWMRALAGAPAEVGPPADRPRPAVPSGVEGSVHLDLDARLHSRLAALANEHRATLFMVVHAGLAALLTRLGCGTDVVVGTTIAGRDDVVLDDLVGFFVNTLVLRVDLSGDPTFGELVDRVRHVDLTAYSNAELPFDRLVEAMNPARSTSGHPLFQVMLEVDGDPTTTIGLPGAEPYDVDVEPGHSRFDLTLGFQAHRDEQGRPAGLRGRIDYSVDLFARSTVEGLAARLGRLLASVADDPGARISSIDLFSAEERDRILHRYNDTSLDLGPTGTVHAEFEEQARRAPGAPAIGADGVAFTYAELDHRANGLARHLRDLGVAPGDLVAVVMDRSPHVVVAMLAIMKAGGAYVPITPGTPESRVREILEDTRAEVVLVDRAGESAHRFDGRTVVVVDGVDLSGYPGTPLGVAVPGAALAYAMYTSGSSGSPKGVAVTHDNVVAFARDRCWDPDRGRRVLVHSANSFDASVYEVWVTLLSGGQLVLAPAGPVDPRALGDTITKHHVTAAYLTTGLFNLMAEECVEPLAGLAELWTSGDVGSPTAVQRVLDQCPNTLLVHGYGPTETTVFASYERFGPDRRQAPSLSLGVPMANTTMYVLDHRFAPVPPGGVGELYVGGSHVARGYLNRPGETAARFVADPFGGRGDRLYRTGDLVRWNANRDMEFIGRADGQVKIRGFRVELGEVESAIARHPLVSQAVVTAFDGGASGKHLVGHVVPARSGLDVAEVRRYLATSVPDYMVPRDLVLVDRLPLNTSGKVDRKALSAVTSTRRSGAGSPRSPREQVLCEVFAEALGLDAVGPDDNFFELGGHSLIAAKMVGRIRSVLDADVGIRTLFQAPTPALLANSVARDDRQALEVVLPLRPGGTRAPLFCVHPGSGLGWAYAGLLRGLDADTPLFGIQTRGLTEPEWLPASLEEMADHYLEQLRTVQPTGPVHLLGWSFGGLVAHAMAVRLREKDEEVGLLALMDSYPPGPDLDKGLPTRQDVLAVLLGEGAGDPGTDRNPPLDLVVRRAKENAVLATFADREVAALVGTVGNHLQLLRGHRPGVFDGDVLFFAATAGRTDASASPERWLDHVGGRLLVHDIPCRHWEMSGSAELRTIGGIVRDRLEAR